MDASVKLPTVDESVLRACFKKYGRVTTNRRASISKKPCWRAIVPKACACLRRRTNAGDPADAQAGLRVFTGRPYTNVVQSYGADFAKALEAAPRDEWRVLPSLEGARVMRLKSVTPAKPATLRTSAASSCRTGPMP